MSMFVGAMTALVTPFRDGAVDETALRELVEFQIAEGIDGLAPCGTTGESFNLEVAEFAQVVRTVVEQTRKRVPVIVGTGTASTQRSIDLTKTAQQLGADGILVTTPYYCRPSQAGLEAHYRALASASTLPMVLYNIPLRTGVDLALDTLERLADVPSIVAIKESTGNVLRSTDIHTRFGDRFTILSGDDGLVLPIMAVGGRGVISVASNLVPAEMKKLVRLAASGDFAAARVQAERLRPLFGALYIEPNPGPLKAALALCERIAPEIRLPMVMPGEQTIACLRSELTTLGVL